MDLIAKAPLILLLLAAQIAWLVFRFHREKRKTPNRVILPRGLLGRLGVALGWWIGGIGFLGLGYYPLVLLWWGTQQTGWDISNFTPTR